MASETLSSEDRRWIERKMRSVRFVEWDRFTLEEDPNNSGEYIVDVYGWIDREEDDYKDFVHLTVWTVDQTLSFTTSSYQYSLELNEQLIGAPPEDHNSCRRVENGFNVSNAIELAEGED